VSARRSTAQGDSFARDHAAPTGAGKRRGGPLCCAATLAAGRPTSSPDERYWCEETSASRPPARRPARNQRPRSRDRDPATAILAAARPAAALGSGSAVTMRPCGPAAMRPVALQPCSPAIERTCGPETTGRPTRGAPRQTAATRPRTPAQQTGPGWTLTTYRPPAHQHLETLDITLTNTLARSFALNLRQQATHTLRLSKRMSLL
jgi:hypothetical protein